MGEAVRAIDKALEATFGMPIKEAKYKTKTLKAYVDSVKYGIQSIIGGIAHAPLEGRRLEEFYKREDVKERLSKGGLTPERLRKSGLTPKEEYPVTMDRMLLTYLTFDLAELRKKFTFNFRGYFPFKVGQEATLTFVSIDNFHKENEYGLRRIDADGVPIEINIEMDKEPRIFL